MKVKRILAMSLVVLLVVAGASPSVVSADTAQPWYLNDTAIATRYEMDKDTRDYTPSSVSIDNGSSVVWIADEASQGCTFPAGTWGGFVWLTSSVSGTITLDVGYWDGTFNSNGNTQDVDPQGAAFLGISIGANLFTVASGDYLAFKMTNSTGATISVYTGGPAQSFLTSPSTDPGYPIPELPTIVLLITGLVGLATYLGLKRRNRVYFKT